MSGSGLRRFVRPEPGGAARAEPSAESAIVAEDDGGGAGLTVPPLVAELLAAAEAGPAPAADPAEKCEMCGTVVPEEHGHVADLEASSLVCACRACYLLFTGPSSGRGRYKAVPDRYLHDPSRPLTAEQWERLQIPVGLAFFLTSSRAGRVGSFYPSPAGVTECELDLAAWTQLATELPLLAEVAPDVEAALISRGEGGLEYFAVPIDVCYELAGRMRLQWRGFDGGAEARASIAEFLDQARSRARPLPETGEGAGAGAGAEAVR